MPKFSIAFILPDENNSLKHKIVEAENKDTALRGFFKKEALEFYSDDEKGFFYFKDDFMDPNAKCGSILEA
ncbi:MAG: hypothetical protein GF398_11840 [Chitinivibrionales bacterium]|nr:hypothetical protein [Chitinivibrionales bacterium]